MHCGRPIRRPESADEVSPGRLLDLESGALQPTQEVPVADRFPDRDPQALRNGAREVVLLGMQPRAVERLDRLADVQEADRMTISNIEKYREDKGK